MAVAGELGDGGWRNRRGEVKAEARLRPAGPPGRARFNRQAR